MHYGASVVHVTCTVKIVIGQTSRTSTTVIGLTSNTCMHAWIWDVSVCMQNHYINYIKCNNLAVGLNLHSILYIIPHAEEEFIAHA